MTTTESTKELVTSMQMTKTRVARFAPKWVVKTKWVVKKKWLGATLFSVSLLSACQQLPKHLTEKQDTGDKPQSLIQKLSETTHCEQNYLIALTAPDLNGSVQTRSDQADKEQRVTVTNMDGDFLRDVWHPCFDHNNPQYHTHLASAI